MPVSIRPAIRLLSTASAASATWPSHSRRPRRAPSQRPARLMFPLGVGGGGMLDRSALMSCHICCRMLDRSPTISGDPGGSTSSSVASENYPVGAVGARHVVGRRVAADPGRVRLPWWVDLPHRVGDELRPRREDGVVGRLDRGHAGQADVVQAVLYRAADRGYGVVDDGSSPARPDVAQVVQSCIVQAGRAWPEGVALLRRQRVEVLLVGGQVRGRARVVPACPHVSVDEVLDQVVALPHVPPGDSTIRLT